MGYDILLVDADRTIFDFDKGEKSSLFKTLNSFSLPESSDVIRDFRKINNSLWEKLERGEIKKEVILTKRFEILFEKYGITLSPEEFNDVYKDFLSQSCQPIVGARKFLKEAKKRGKRVYVITNGTAYVQNKRFSLSSLSRYFDGVFISEEVGYAKPDKRYFEYVFSHVPNFSLQKTLLIGDSVSADIQGALNAGIHSVLFSPKKTDCTLASFTVKKLTDILNII